MNEPLNVALIGCGTYGKVHARVYRSDPRVRLTALWTPTPARRERAAREFGCRAAATWQEIVADDRIDAVAVTTPDFAHAEYAVAALRAGKHVLLEKPMATTTRECQTILAARDAGGGKLMVNYHNRWYPAFKAAHDAIAAGRIGKPVAANFVLSDTIAWVENNMTWANRTGPEWFLMSHIADLAFWMLREKPVEVSAMAREGLLKSKGFDTRDLVKATLRMDGGAIVHLESSWILARNWRNPINDMWLSVQGETGRLDVAADYENLTIVGDKYETPFTLLDLTETPPIRDFITCVVEDKPVPVTGEEAMLATQTVEAVVRSYTEGRVVPLDEVA